MMVKLTLIKVCLDFTKKWDFPWVQIVKTAYFILNISFL